METFFMDLWTIIRFSFSWRNIKEHINQRVRSREYIFEEYSRLYLYDFLIERTTLIWHRNLYSHFMYIWDYLDRQNRLTSQPHYKHKLHHYTIRTYNDDILINIIFICILNCSRRYIFSSKLCHKLEWQSLYIYI